MATRSQIKAGDPLSIVPADEEEERVRRGAERQYLLCRDQGLSCEAAVAEIVLQHEGDETLPPLPIDTVNAWRYAECWEQAFQALVGADILQLESLRAERRLEDAVDDSKRARSLFVRSYLDAAGANGGAPKLPDVQKFRLAYQTLGDAEKAVTEAEQRLVRRSMVTEALPEQRARLEEIRAKLLRQYGGLGPQYEILVDQLAGAQLRSEQLRFTSDVASDENTRITNTILSVSAQLQKYTESQKTEVMTTEIKRTVKWTLAIVELVLKDSPEKMRTIMNTVAKELERGNTQAQIESAVA